jgi:hypothetical protein
MDWRSVALKLERSGRGRRVANCRASFFSGNGTVSDLGDVWIGFSMVFVFCEALAATLSKGTITKLAM